jgi:DNA-binding CsgD family transcriptional regulator
MITGHLAQNLTTTPNISIFEHGDAHTDASYDRMLARQETELRQALAKVQALRRQQGEVTQLSEGVLRALYTSRETAACRIASLTPRQREILELILAGRPNKIIAWELGISQRSVESHRASIMKSTGSKSLPALARLAIAAMWNGTSQPPAWTPGPEDRAESGVTKTWLSHESQPH